MPLNTKRLATYSVLAAIASTASLFFTTPSLAVDFDSYYTPGLVLQANTINPAVQNKPRRRMTLKLSLDGGLSWPRAYHLLLDEGSSAGYPSLTMIGQNSIGVFYEGSQAHLSFQRIALDELLELDPITKELER